jgi:AcrR family transcriptional regulator
MREIAATAGMLPGSLYYHFPSKDELLLAVCEEGVRRIAERLDAACVAHLEMRLEAGGDYAQVVIRMRPEDCPAMAPRLVALRDAHEGRFRALIAALGSEKLENCFGLTVAGAGCLTESFSASKLPLNYPIYLDTKKKT